DGGAAQVDLRGGPGVWGRFAPNAARREVDPVDLAGQLLAQPEADAGGELLGAVGQGGELDLLLVVEVLAGRPDARAELDQLLAEAVGDDVRLPDAEGLARRGARSASACARLAGLPGDDRLEEAVGGLAGVLKLFEPFG